MCSCLISANAFQTKNPKTNEEGNEPPLSTTYQAKMKVCTKKVNPGELLN